MTSTFTPAPTAEPTHQDVMRLIYAFQRKTKSQLLGDALARNEEERIACLLETWQVHAHFSGSAVYDEAAGLAQQLRRAMAA